MLEKHFSSPGLKGNNTPLFFITINKQVHVNIYSLLCCMKYLCNASMYCTKIPIFPSNIMWCSPQSLQKHHDNLCLYAL